MNCPFIFGQKLYFSNIPRLNSKAYYNKVIGENEGGIYILRFRDPELKGGFNVERYSHNLDFIESESLELDKKEKLLKVFTTDSGLVFVKLSYKQDQTEISMLRTGFSIDDRQVMKTIFHSQRIEKIDDNAVVDYNLNRNLFSIWISEINENSEQVFVFLKVDLSGNTLHQTALKTQFHYRVTEPNKSCITNQGDAAMIFERVKDDKRQGDPGHTEHFVCTVNGNSEVSLFGLGDHNYFLSSFDFVVNEFKNSYAIAGLYDFNKPLGGHGIVNYNFNTDSSLPAAVFSPFDRKFVSSLIGARQEKDGEDPENFRVRKMIPRNDGGNLLICEFFEITQQLETFYLNGVPQTSSKNVYNYNDLLFVSIDSSGVIEWRNKVNKRQTSFASLAYLQSVGIYVCEKNINIIYNDNSSQNNRVMHLKLSRNGTLEQKIILNSENEYTAVIPLEGRQTGYNRFVTPLLMNKQTMLLQLIDEK